MGVHLLRSLRQADTLISQVDEAQQLVIIGNSFIGMEVAGALRNRDIDVTVVARHPLPFASQFGEEIGRHFYELHRSNGVKFVEGEPEALSGEGAVSGVRLKGGKNRASQPGAVCHRHCAGHPFYSRPALTEGWQPAGRQSAAGQ